MNAKTLLAALLATTAPLIVKAQIPVDDTAAYTAAAREHYRRVLKDPDAAQFRNLFVAEYTTKYGTKITILCGEVNAKNSYGGYVGFRSFAVESDGKDWYDPITGYIHEDVATIRCSGSEVPLTKREGK